MGAKGETLADEEKGEQGAKGRQKGQEREREQLMRRKIAINSIVK